MGSVILGWGFTEPVPYFHASPGLRNQFLKITSSNAIGTLSAGEAWKYGTGSVIPGLRNQFHKTTPSNAIGTLSSGEAWKYGTGSVNPGLRKQFLKITPSNTIAALSAGEAWKYRTRSVNPNRMRAQTNRHFSEPLPSNHTSNAFGTLGPMEIRNRFSKSKLLYTRPVEVNIKNASKNK